jgi:hypothetical protein
MSLSIGRAVAVTIVIGALVAGILAMSSPGVRGEERPEHPTWDETATFLGLAPQERGLVGEQLGDALGLEPVAGFPVTGCGAFAEIQDGVGYCLDEASEELPTLVHQSILANQLQGTPLSTEEIANVEETLRRAGELP